MKNGKVTTEMYSARWLAASRKSEVQVSEKEIGDFFSSLLLSFGSRDLNRTVKSVPRMNRPEL